MRHISKVVFLFMLLLCTMAWARTIYTTLNEKNAYKTHLVRLSEFERKGIYIDAIHEVEELLKIKPDNMKFHIKYANLHRKLGNERIFIEKSEELIRKYPKEKGPIISLANHYAQKGHYSEAIYILKKAKQVDEGKQIEELYTKLKGKFIDRYEVFDDMKAWHNQISFIKSDSHWAMMYKDGKSNHRFVYEEVGGFDSREKVFPAKINGEWIFFDEKENRKLVPDKKYEMLGTFSEGFAPVKRKGKAGYIDRNFNEFTMKFKITGAFKNGIAAVMDQDGNWRFIRKDFTFLSNEKYEDIIRNEYGFCSEFGVAFVKKKTDYFLVNLEGKKIGNFKFDAVKNFESNQFAAVRIADKWGYIDQNGKWVIKPKYTNANSFTIGCAGVEIDGLWGFIDTKGRMLIEPQFSEVKPFTTSGIAPVRESETWHMIQLYEYIK